MIVALLVSVPNASRAQLISPGKLSSEHAELEGIRSCTSCHDLGHKGASSTKCLSCHKPIASRVARKEGFHSSMTGQDCATCHKEHFGRDFQLVRFDTTTFDHAHAGFQLDGAHARVNCGDCHTASRIKAADVQAWTREHASAATTMLGLATTCASCHSSDDPHGGQFRQTCESCHSARDWKRPDRFDHSSSGYRLTGGHRTASCDGCHPSVRANGTSRARYKGTAASNCAGCHDDAHAGRMGGGCSTCHDPAGWTSVDRNAVAGRFDHSRTRFPLEGRHAAAGCPACHSPAGGRADLTIRFAAGNRNASYPRPVADTCASCHRDLHGGEFGTRSGDGSCSACHGEAGWTPARFDIDQHDRTTRFALTGAHKVQPCNSCHVRVESGALQFRIANSGECRSCHRETSPHGERFADRDCAACHGTTNFQVGTFDHTGVEGECRSCHATKQPHGDQFGDADCSMCHTTRAYRIESFDHSKTRYKLDGAHTRVACGSCHVAVDDHGVTVVRYRPLETPCAACHGARS
jgi:hypothetical protein